MTWALLAVAASGWVLSLLLLLLLPARARREAMALCLRLRSHVRPYLHRRAVEAGLETSHGTSAPQHADAVVADLCQLADQLARLERSQVELGDTVNIGVSDTMPIVLPSDGVGKDR